MEQTTLKKDFFLTSKNALSKDGIAAALENEGANIPETGDVDWSGVDTINQVDVRLSFFCRQSRAKQISLPLSFPTYFS